MVKRVGLPGEVGLNVTARPCPSIAVHWLVVRHAKPSRDPPLSTVTGVGLPGDSGLNVTSWPEPSTTVHWVADGHATAGLPPPSTVTGVGLPGEFGIEGHLVARTVDRGALVRRGACDPVEPPTTVDRRRCRAARRRPDRTSPRSADRRALARGGASNRYQWPGTVDRGRRRAAWRDRIERHLPPGVVGGGALGADGQVTARRYPPGSTFTAVGLPGEVGSNVTSSPWLSTAVHWLADGTRRSVRRGRSRRDRRRRPGRGWIEGHLLPRIVDCGALARRWARYCP